jgi:hypothetical protein
MNRPPYQDVERIGPNAYGMVGVISQRLNGGMITFAIFREWERDGQIERTGFVAEKDAEVYMDFARIVIDRIRELRKSGGFPVPPPALPPSPVAAGEAT